MYIWGKRNDFKKGPKRIKLRNFRWQMILLTSEVKIIQRWSALGKVENTSSFIKKKAELCTVVWGFRWYRDGKVFKESEFWQSSIFCTTFNGLNNEQGFLSPPKLFEWVWMPQYSICIVNNIGWVRTGWQSDREVAFDRTSMLRSERQLLLPFGASIKISLAKYGPLGNTW